MTREEAIDLLDNLVGMVDDNHGSDYDEALKMGKEALKQESSRSHGEWIKQPDHKIKKERVYWQCSRCQEYICAKDYFDQYTYCSFCPNCGAKMKSGEET